MTRSTIRKIFLFLFFAVWIGVGFYRYGFERIYHPYSQWDLKTHIAATQRAIGDQSQFDSDFVRNAYLPPYVPFGYLILHLLGNLNWEIVRFGWVVCGTILITFLIYANFRSVGPTDPDLTKRHFGLILLLIFLFKGTFLALAAGQISVLVIFLLIQSFNLQNKSEISSALLLAFASFKPNLALPFFLFLLVRKKYRLFFLAAAAATLINLGISFMYLGPIGHLNQIWQSFQQLESVSQNSYLLKAFSGRVDLAPFLAAFGIESILMHTMQAIIFPIGLSLSIIYRRHMSDRLLLLNSVTLFFFIFYYRDYDVLLPLLIASPLIWTHRNKFKWWHIFLFFPAVMPIQRISSFGIDMFPAGEFIFSLIGTSMIISIATLVLSLNGFQIARMTLSTKNY